MQVHTAICQVLPKWDVYLINFKCFNWLVHQHSFKTKHKLIKPSKNCWFEKLKLKTTENGGMKPVSEINEKWELLVNKMWIFSQLV